MDSASSQPHHHAPEEETERDRKEEERQGAEYGRKARGKSELEREMGR